MVQNWTILKAMLLQPRRLKEEDFDSVFRLCYLQSGYPAHMKERVRDEYLRQMNEGCAIASALQLVDGEMEVVGVFSSVFVSEAFVEESRQAEEPYTHPKLKAACEKGRSPFIGAQEAKKLATVDAFLAYFGWRRDWPDPRLERELRGALVRHLVRKMRPYPLNRLLVDVSDPSLVPQTIRAGHHVFNSYPKWKVTEGMPVDHGPHLMILNEASADEAQNLLLTSMFAKAHRYLDLTGLEKEAIKALLKGATLAETGEWLMQKGLGNYSDPAAGVNAIVKRIFKKAHRRVPNIILRRGSTQKKVLDLVKQLPDELH